MNSSTIIWIGVIVSCFGSAMVAWGNIQLSKEQSKQLSESVRDIKSQIITVGREEIDQITNTLVIDQRLTRIINDLTLPDKWTLIRFIQGYMALKREDWQDMVNCLNDYYAKFPSERTKDPFDTLSRKEIIINKKEKNGIMESELTPLGKKVVSILVKDRITPFDRVAQK